MRDPCPLSELSKKHLHFPLLEIMQADWGEAWRGTFWLLLSEDYTDETINNIRAIEMTWQDSKIYFIVYLNTFVSETMEWSLSVQFNPFLPFLLSQEMLKEIYVAVWKSEFLISDTEKEITVRKRHR